VEIPEWGNNNAAIHRFGGPDLHGHAAGHPSLSLNFEAGRGK